MQKSSFIDRIVEKASQNAVLMRAIYLNILKKQMQSTPSKKCVMTVKCGCEENDFDVLVTERDIERVYNRFAKKCPTCEELIKITFKFEN